MVYTMLLEAGDVTDPLGFKETDLYRRCVAAGVIPASQEQLAELYPRDRMTDQKPDDIIEDKEDSATLWFQCRVGGMWCPACAWVIQTAIFRIPGVASAQCDFALDRLKCRYHPAETTPGEIERAVKRLGYTPQGDATGEPARRAGEFMRLLVSMVLSVNVMMLSWALYSGFFTELTVQGIRYLSWPIFILTTIVFVYSGAALFRRAWSGIRIGYPGMEVLIVLGAGSAYLLSVINFQKGNLHLYFDTAAMLLTLMLLGKYLEDRAKEKVRRELEGFISLQPRKVRLCTPQFPKGRYVAAGQLAVGDRLRVDPGDIVAADGHVLQGRALVDVSTITGEAEPVNLSRGDTVTSGSRIIDGRLDVEARLVGDDALLGQMIAVVKESLFQKNVTDNPASRGLAVFVPLMVFLALLTAVTAHVLGLPLSQALVRGITVLVVACPCALGIAVPLARVAGISGARQRGIMVRDFSAFGHAGRIDGVVFDKTGTVTEGKWALAKIELTGPLTRDQVLALAFALERRVDHIIARAICDVAEQQGIAAAPVIGIQSAEGGMAGRYHQQTVRIGSRRFVAGKPGVENFPSPSHINGSQVFLALDNQLQAVFIFNDTLRPSAEAVTAELRQSGYDLHLISGDTPAATRDIASALGIDRAVAGLLPQEKAAYIGKLQARGAKIAMVGDGVNDAPALARADLSVVMHSGAGLSRQVGMITLMRSDPLQLPTFFRWAQRVNRKITLNLRWAWLYNLIGVPLAMAGLLTPLVAVSAMLLSSLSVIGNTLLLVRRPEVSEGKGLRSIVQGSQFKVHS